MSNIIIAKNLSVEEKLSLMSEDAGYDICDNEPKSYGILTMLCK